MRLTQSLLTMRSLSQYYYHHSSSNPSSNSSHSWCCSSSSFLDYDTDFIYSTGYWGAPDPSTALGPLIRSSAYFTGSFSSSGIGISFHFTDITWFPLLLHKDRVSMLTSAVLIFCLNFCIFLFPIAHCTFYLVRDIFPTVFVLTFHHSGIYFIVFYFIIVFNCFPFISPSRFEVIECCFSPHNSELGQG